MQIKNEKSLTLKKKYGINQGKLKIAKKDIYFNTFKGKSKLFMTNKLKVILVLNCVKKN